MQDDDPPSRRPPPIAGAKPNTPGSRVKLTDLSPEQGVRFLLSLQWTKAHQAAGILPDSRFIKLTTAQLGATVGEDSAVDSPILKKIYETLESIHRTPDDPHPMDVDVDFLPKEGLSDDGMIQILMPKRVLTALRVYYQVDIQEKPLGRS